MIDPEISPSRYPHDYGTPVDQKNASINSWRQNNSRLLKDGDQERHRSDRLVEDSLRLCTDRYEANKLAETQVKQKLEERVDAVGYWEDELEGMLHDLKVEDDKLQLCHSRLCESVEKNLRPLWNLASRCLQLRAIRPAKEATEDEINFLLRDEIKLSERTTRYFGHVIAKLEDQHRLNNAITYRCKTLKLLDRESHEAAKVCDDLARTDGMHPHQRKNLLVQLNPVKMNFAQWSVLCQDAVRTGLREISASNTLRLAGDDALTAANENIEKLYEELDEAFGTRIMDLKKAKTKLLDEYRKVQESVQKVRTVMDNLNNLLKTLVTPERISQHEMTRRALITELHKQNDPVHNVLKQDIEEFRHGNRKAAGNLDECEKQLVNLRGVSNQLMEDIKRKEAALEIDEVQCLSLRNATKFKKVEPGRTPGLNPMRGDAIKLLGKDDQAV